MIRFCALFVTFVWGAAWMAAQAGASDPLPGVDLSGLTAAQRAAVVKILSARECGCTCGMKVAECRVKDPACGYSKGVSMVLVEAIKSGKGEAAAIALADASQWAHLPAEDTRILGDPVKLSTEGAPVTGPADAKIKLVEFSDFQCPYCIMATPQLQALLKMYPGQVSLTFKQFPLDNHSQAAVAALAALAAQKQGKFWEMHDALFAQNGHLSRDIILGIASKIGLSIMRFSADLNSPELKKVVERDVAEGEKAGVQGTPTVFINGQRYNGAVKTAPLKGIIDAELKANATTAALSKP